RSTCRRGKSPGTACLQRDRSKSATTCHSTYSNARRKADAQDTRCAQPSGGACRPDRSPTTLESGNERGLCAHGNAFASVVVGSPTFLQNAVKCGSCW